MGSHIGVLLEGLWVESEQLLLIIISAAVVTFLVIAVVVVTTVCLRRRSKLKVRNIPNKLSVRATERFEYCLSEGNSRRRFDFQREEQYQTPGLGAGDAKTAYADCVTDYEGLTVKTQVITAIVCQCSCSVNRDCCCGC